MSFLKWFLALAFLALVAGAIYYFTLPAAAPVVQLYVSPLRDSTVASGATVTWTVVATGGTGSYEYLWQQVNAAKTVYTPLSNTTDTLSTTASASQTDGFRCFVTSGSQSVGTFVVFAYVST
jgi:hypothetical protein